MSCCGGEPIPSPVATETTGLIANNSVSLVIRNKRGVSQPVKLFLEVSALVLRNATQRRRHQRWGCAHARPGEIHRTPVVGGISARAGRSPAVRRHVREVCRPPRGRARLPRTARWSRIDTEPTTTFGASVAITLFDELNDVLADRPSRRPGLRGHPRLDAGRRPALRHDSRMATAHPFTAERVNGRRADRGLSRRRMPRGRSGGQIPRDRPAGGGEQVHRPGVAANAHRWLHTWSQWSVPVFGGTSCVRGTAVWALMIDQSRRQSG